MELPHPSHLKNCVYTSEYSSGSAYKRAPFGKHCHHNLVRLPLHLVSVSTPIYNQPRRGEMNRTVLILLGLAVLVTVGYALPANSEKRPTTELEAHVQKRLTIKFWKSFPAPVDRNRQRVTAVTPVTAVTAVTAVTTATRMTMTMMMTAMWLR